MRKRHLLLLIGDILLFLAASFALAAAGDPRGARADASAPVVAASADARLNLPLVASGVTIPTAPPETPEPSPEARRRVNAPYFGETVTFSRAAVFWLGRVNNTDNYTDVRIGYNDRELVIYTATFDRRLWYDPANPPASMTEWDALTLYLDLDGSVGNSPDGNSYLVQRQLNRSEPDASYQAVYRGAGGEWQQADVAITTNAGWRGNSPNDDVDDRGWTSEIHIPFGSLGLARAPAEGTIWGLAVTTHDRDARGSAPNALHHWPEGLDAQRPVTWGQLRFGIPAYAPPAASPGDTVTVRHGLNGATVADAMVGGSTDCGSALSDFFSQWGEANYAGSASSNVQNQGDVADWPCFAKTYLTFPLDAVPQGKVILSARLRLHQFGNAGAGWNPGPVRSLIWVHTVNEPWDEAAITWNNAPLSGENLSAAWVDILDGFPGWPGVPREWDVSRAAAQAYAADVPLRIALYSADAAYHSGKYFSLSDAEDWNAVARPTLEVAWGNP